MKHLFLILCLALCFPGISQTTLHHPMVKAYHPTPLEWVKNYILDIAEESYSVKTKGGWVIRYRPTGRKNYETIGRGSTELKAWRDAKNYIDGKKCIKKTRLAT